MASHELGPELWVITPGAIRTSRIGSWSRSVSAGRTPLSQSASDTTWRDPGTTGPTRPRVPREWYFFSLIAPGCYQTAMVGLQPRGVPSILPVRRAAL